LIGIVWLGQRWRTPRLLSPNREPFDASVPKRALIPQTLAPPFLRTNCGIFIGGSSV